VAAAQYEVLPRQFIGRAEDGNKEPLSAHSPSPRGDLNPQPPEQETAVPEIRSNVQFFRR
jgi:hypothetical protein